MAETNNQIESASMNNFFHDNREEVLDKLGILDDARMWYTGKHSELEGKDGVTEYLDDRFGKHIFCDNCHSLIDSSRWGYYGLYKGYSDEVDKDKHEKEYFDIICPICGKHKRVDEDKHPELYPY